jgi:hypothetical protein
LPSALLTVEYVVSLSAIVAVIVAPRYRSAGRIGDRPFNQRTRGLSENQGGKKHTYTRETHRKHGRCFVTTE